MLSLDSIEKTIIELEAKDTTFSNCERLAPLYIVRDHLRGYNVSPEATIALEGESDFLKAINGKNPNLIFPIIDKLMEVEEVLHPRIYDQTMAELKVVQ